jgi:hypothetical protein
MGIENSRRDPALPINQSCEAIPYHGLPLLLLFDYISNQ